MDGSFLSQAEVIAAAQKFVCVRLATYEDKQEADFLKTLFTGRSGDLENTTFAILSPDGKRPLVRSSRSARQSLGIAREMAETMNRIAQQFEPRKTAGEPELPRVANVRLALEVCLLDWPRL